MSLFTHRCMPMAFEFHTKRRVEFAETDMAGIAHFSNYFRYMEMAEHEFLRSLDTSVHARVHGGVVGWPRVRAECSFRAPLEFEEVVHVHLLVREKTKKTITYVFRFRKEDGQPAAEGSITVICVAFDPATKQMSAISIPRWLDEKIEVAPAELLEA